jgi:hypothetical protein
VRAVERGLLERAPLRYKVEALIARLDTLSGRKTEKPARSAPTQQPNRNPHRPA